MMRKQFVRNQSNQFLVKKKKALLEKIARVMNRLSEKEEEFVVEDVEDFDKEIIQKTETLRSQFFYCIYCGAQFRDKDELQKVCPGNNEDLHG
jgi:predicted Zn-ribbon and HTH transcriptional regulator